MKEKFEIESSQLIEERANAIAEEKLLNKEKPD
jgi:hypothetical protein